MLTIESKEVEYRDQDGNNQIIHHIIVNGVEDHDSFYSGGIFPSAHIYDEVVEQILLNSTFKEVGTSLTYFRTGWDIDGWDDGAEVEIYCAPLHHEVIPTIKSVLESGEWEHWNKPWSMAQVAKQFEQEILKLNNKQIQYWQEDPDSMLNGFGIKYFPGDSNSTIKPHVEKVLDLTKAVIAATIRHLIQYLNPDTVIAYFKFPEDIRVACEQYLVYFSQFISDLGLAVETEIREELNQTLFKVTPRDKNDSLEKIRDALNVYLNAPSERAFDVQIAEYSDVAARHWEANVYHLKSQLILAQSSLQLKDAAIESLKLTLYQYEKLLPPQQQKLETEEIVKDLVAIKKYDGKWFSINLPEILRRMKRQFR